MCKISIIVPVHNTELYIKECINSILNQTMKDIEIIVIDDASTDNSLSILKQYAEKYPQIKLYNSDKNIGQGAARNVGLSVAKGEYIGFVDSDDLVEKNMYETMYNGAIKYNYPDVISSGIEIVCNDDMKKKKSSGVRLTEKFIDLKKYPMQVYWESPSCCNKIFKKELIDDYKFLEKCNWEDVAFTYSMLIKANNVLFFPDRLYTYRKIRRHSVSTKGYETSSPLNDSFRVADEIENVTNKYQKNELYKDVLPLIQNTVCLQRLEEINSWPISQEEKEPIMIEYYKQMCSRYGNPNDYDLNILASKTSVNLIEKMEELTNSDLNKKNSI